jgi:hypothetical protein
VVAGLIPIKTPEGQAELGARKRSVSQRHRTVLFLIDGKRTAEEVRTMALQAGVPGSCFGELIELGMIMLSEPTFSLLLDDPASRPGVLHVDLPLPGPDSLSAIPDSMLPPSRSLFPESASTDSTLGSISTAQAWLTADASEPEPLDDPVFIEARLILVRAVRAQAPLAGTLARAPGPTSAACSTKSRAASASRTGRSVPRTPCGACARCSTGAPTR